MVSPAMRTGPKLRLGSYAPGRYRVRVEGSGGVVEAEHEIPDKPSVTLTIDVADVLHE